MSKRDYIVRLVFATILILAGSVLHLPSRTTANPGTLPVVTTSNATGISAGGAALNGVFTNNGTALSADVSFQWGTSSGNYTDETSPLEVNSGGNFFYSLYSLSAVTTYYFRAKAVGDGTSYGEEKSFTTPTIQPPSPIVPPSVTTIAVDNITTASARLSGEVTSLGSTFSGNVSVAFRWGLDSYNYVEETPAISTNVTGPFSYVLTGLSANTTYYVSAWAIAPFPNSSNEMSLTTLAETVPPPPFGFKWGSFGNNNGLFSSPIAVALDASGNVYVTDYGNNRIQKFTSSGIFLTQWGIYGSGDGQFNSPVGVAVDVSGDVYVADQSNNRIQKFTSAGEFITKWGIMGSGDGQLYYPQGIAVDSSGDVYVTDGYNRRVQKFTNSGVFVTKWGSYGSGDGQFNDPKGVAIDASGNIYVADYSNNRIQKFTSSGVFLTKWGNYGSGDGEFDAPQGVAIDASGNVYVTELFNNRVQKFTNTGVYITKWGSFGSGAGSFIAPWGIAANASGNVYVVDINRVQVFGVAPPQTPPTVTTYRVFDFGTWPWLNGYLDSLGSAITANVSFELGQSSGNYTFETPAISMNATGPFTWVANGLPDGTLYYFRTKAIGDGTSYGVEKVFFTPVHTAPVLVGDVNGDGLVNAVDITKLERVIVGLDASTFGADANRDGNINALDITMVERIIAGL